MDWYATLKRHYDAGRYSTADLGNFVIAGKITPQQYETITSVTYGGTS